MADFHSTVSDLIVFEPTENPEWRADGDRTPNIQCMIRQIVSYQQEGRKGNFVVSRELERKFLDKLLFQDTKNGLDGDSKDERRLNKEEKNLDNAYQYLLDIKKEESDEEFHGFIEESMLRETHKIILEGIELQQKATKPGVYSNKKRITDFHKETYQYQYPKDMHVAVVKCLDKYNSLYADAQSESDDEKKLEKLFKACSWFVFEMLDLHPFGDGNGRLCRILCSYVLSTCTPFPTPIYVSNSKSSKDYYMQALVDARKSKDRHPCSLTTMIIECNSYAWKELMKEI